MTSRSAAAPYLYGSAAGVALALALLAFVGGLTSLSTVETGVVPEITATASMMGVVVFGTAAFAGLVLSAATYALARALDPDTPRFSFPMVAVVGILVAATIAFAVMSLGTTLVGSLVDGVITVPVTGLVAVSATAGLTAGAVTAPIVDGIARRASVGEANEATPISATEFWSDFGRAIAIPAVAIAAGALLAFGFAQVLLGAESTAVTVAVFGVVGALVLGGTTLLATRPWDRESPPEE